MTRRRQAGFSLVEMAVVMVIVGLMIGGLLTPLSVQLEQRKSADTRKTLDEAREALLGFALRNGYLPCPAVSASNGLEDRSGAECSDGKRQGFIPWATLGVGKLDAWDHLLRYSVTPAYANSGQPFGLTTRRDITIGTRDARGNLVGASAIGDIPAVLLSHGRNGAGAVSALGIRVAGASGRNLDERTNAGESGIAFVTRLTDDNPNAPGGEFDDVVLWISPNILFNRMVAAGVLPR
ncbi:MAG: prepilin-type N-terminal cleavage/methylation domain-containing protein [Massilia sp.]